MSEEVRIVEGNGGASGCTFFAAVLLFLVALPGAFFLMWYENHKKIQQWEESIQPIKVIYGAVRSENGEDELKCLKQPRNQRCASYFLTDKEKGKRSRWECRTCETALVLMRQLYTAERPKRAQEVGYCSLYFGRGDLPQQYFKKLQEAAIVPPNYGSICEGLKQHLDRGWNGPVENF